MFLLNISLQSSASNRFQNIRFSYIFLRLARKNVFWIWKYCSRYHCYRRFWSPIENKVLKCFLERRIRFDYYYYHYYYYYYYYYYYFYYYYCCYYYYYYFYPNKSNRFYESLSNRKTFAGPNSAQLPFLYAITQT